MGFYLHSFKLFVNGISIGNSGDICGIHNQNKFIEDFEMFIYGTYDYGEGYYGSRLKSILTLFIAFSSVDFKTSNKIKLLPA